MEGGVLQMWYFFSNWLVYCQEIEENGIAVFTESVDSYSCEKYAYELRLRRDALYGHKSINCACVLYVLKSFTPKNINPDLTHESYLW